MVGVVGGLTDANQPTLFDTFNKQCIVWGVGVGSRLQFEEMNRAIVVNNIHPVVDKRVFGFREAREAYQYLVDQRHVGKVCIRIRD